LGYASWLAVDTVEGTQEAAREITLHGSAWAQSGGQIVSTPGPMVEGGVGAQREEACLMLVANRFRDRVREVHADLSFHRPRRARETCSPVLLAQKAFISPFPRFNFCSGPDSFLTSIRFAFHQNWTSIPGTNHSLPSSCEDSSTTLQQPLPPSYWTESRCRTRPSKQHQ